MRTPRFWYPRKGDRLAGVWKALLTPFTFLFRVGAQLRAWRSKPYKARVPLFCVGNVVAGGAGKTPTALALASLLKDRGHRPVFVTRGYGGGGHVLRVDPACHGVADVGDEALLLAKTAPCWVGRDRVGAIRAAEQQGTCVIVDDGLQNPHFAPTASFLVVDAEVGIGNGALIPAGPLRESLDSAVARCAALILIGDVDTQNMAARVNIPVFRAHIEPVVPEGFRREGRFVAFAGIARPQKFYATAQALGLDLVATQDFPDHHLFTPADIAILRRLAQEKGARLLTTEKDAVRLPVDFQAEITILPVRLVFNAPGAEEALAIF